MLMPETTGFDAFDEETRILTVHISEPVNKLFVLEYNQAILPLRDSLAGTQWASIVLLEKDLVLNPDAMRLANSSARHAHQSGLVATAIITSDEQLIANVERVVSRMYVNTGVRYKVGTDLPAAKRWLRSQLSTG